MLTCLNYNSETCTGSYEKCVEKITCQNSVNQCFLHWKKESTVVKVLSAGCQTIGNEFTEKSSTECVGQVKEAAYYYCCTKNLCNDIRLMGGGVENNPIILSYVLFSVVIILFILGLISTLIYKSRRRIMGVMIGATSEDNHNRGSTGSNEDSIELSEVIERDATGKKELLMVKITNIKDLIQPRIMKNEPMWDLPAIGHPNILNSLIPGKCGEEKVYWTMNRYVIKSSMHDYLKNNLVMWKHCLGISLGIADGLAYLHDLGIAHRNIKSENIVFINDLTPCIVDLSGAVFLDIPAGYEFDQRRFRKLQRVGEPSYMAPEVLKRSVTLTEDSFKQVDVYALSLVIWELLSRCHPLPRKIHSENQQQSNQPDPQEFLQKPSTSDHQQEQELLESANAIEQAEQIELDNIPPHLKPFEEIAGAHPNIKTMKKIVVKDKIRPTIRDGWRVYPISELSRSIEEGWSDDPDARITATCYAQRIQTLLRTFWSGDVAFLNHLR